MARRIVIAALPAIPALLVLAVAALYPTDQLYPNQGDLGLYLDKARAFAAGSVPYRDFPFEYPPLAIVSMAAPYLVGNLAGPVDLDSYKWLFAGWEALLLLAVGLTLARIVALGGDAEAPSIRSTDDRSLRTGLRMILLTVGALLAITFRFDLLPTLCMVVALWAALAGRAGVAGVALGLGVLVKLFPIAVLPALAIPWLLPFDPRGLLRLGGGAAAMIVAGLVPFVAVAGGESTFQFLRYNAERGLEVETIGGGLAVLNGLLTGHPIEYDYRFSSVNANGAVAEAWLALLPVLTILGFGLVAWLGWRRISAERGSRGEVQRSTIVALATISVLVLLVTAKVYSIQYVVWIVPLVALLGGRQFWLAAAIVALTMPIHPVLFEGLVHQEALPILVLNARNALLIGLLAWLLRDLVRQQRAPGDEGVARPAGLEPTTFRSAT